MHVSTNIPIDRDAWNRIADAMSFPTPFASWEWATAWKDEYHPSAPCTFLLVRHGTQLCAILALAPVQKGFLGKRMALMPLGTELVGADHAALIAARPHADNSARAIAKFLRDSFRDWAELRFPLVADDDLHLSPAGALASEFRSTARRVSAAPYLLVDGSFESYLQRLSANERYKLRNRSRKLLSQEGVKYRAFSRQECEEALSKLLSLHRQRAVLKAVQSTFDAPDVASFHRRLLALLPWDRVVLRGLTHGGEPFAMFYGFRFGDRIFYFQLGYDPAWSSSSPGLVLLTEVIKEAFEDGCVEFNFLQGEEPFKRTWTRAARQLHGLRVYNDTPLGWLSYQTARGRTWLHDAIKRWAVEAA